MPTCHAYYSEKQAAISAVNVYRLANGTEAEVSEVSTQGSNWPDAADLGELATEDSVQSWVRNVKRGDDRMICR